MAQRFLIASHGWSGSYWLAHALHAQEGIACVHSGAALPADTPDPYSIDAILENGTLADVYAKLGRLREGYVARATRLPSELYKDVETRFPEACLVGSVHTFRMRDLASATSDLGPTGADETAISVANLLRHPVTLVRSGYGQFLDSMAIDLNEHAWIVRRVAETDLPAFEAISARYGVRPGSFDALCFLGACCTLTGLAQDFRVARAIADDGNVAWLGHILMERAISDPDYLARWIERLNGAPLPLSPGSLEAAVSGGPRNRHNRATGTETPDGVFAEWSDWQRAIFVYCLDLFGLRAPYEAVGYDLSMLPRPGSQGAVA